MKKVGGFSLVETIIAIMVLAIGIISIMGAYSYYVKADNYSKIKTLELAIAKGKMEEFLATSSVSLNNILNSGDTVYLETYSEMGDGYLFKTIVSVDTVNISGLATPPYKIMVHVAKRKDNGQLEDKGVKLIAIREK